MTEEQLEKGKRIAMDIQELIQLQEFIDDLPKLQVHSMNVIGKVDGNVKQYYVGSFLADFTLIHSYPGALVRKIRELKKELENL